jgi:hypothetical protein
MEPVTAETAAVAADTIGRRFSQRAREQVLHVCCDDPSGIMFEKLRLVLPNVQTLCLDPTHLPMVYEYSSGYPRRRPVNNLGFLS